MLWFSPTPSLYTSKVWAHNGGGWISALETMLKSEPSIELGVAFEYTIDKKEVLDSVTYYPMCIKKTMIDKFNRQEFTEKRLKEAQKVIEDFKPDIIQLFGSESWYGLITQRVTIPIVIHMQGSLPPSYNARYPVGISIWSKIFSAKTSLKQKIMAFRTDATFKRNAEMEEMILRINSNFMGRTHWDRAIVELYNPNAQYFKCNEALRENFINTPQKWQFHDEGKIRLLTTISGPLYKGVDVILKTAKLLKENSTIDFEWEVCGIKESSFIEDCYKIRAVDVNVKFAGVKNDEELKDKLLNCSLFIHPSYIDNSPNSICEAQILGVPVISTNVGGISSLIEEGKTGLLFPANDPFMLSHLIIHAVCNKELLEAINQNAILVASERHNPSVIKNDLINIYNTVIANDIND